MKLFLILTIFWLENVSVDCHDRFWGECPTFKPMQNFEWKKFSTGRWYATDQFDTRSKCLTYDFYQDSINGNITDRYVVKSYVPPGKILPPLKMKGKIGTISENNMTIRYPLSLMGTYSFYVLDTDYDKYALFCSCKTTRVVFKFHSITCAILQRKERDENITKKLRDLLRTQLNNKKIDSYFNVINQKGCTYTDSNFVTPFEGEFIGPEFDCRSFSFCPETNDDSQIVTTTLKGESTTTGTTKSPGPTTLKPAIDLSGIKKN